MRAWTFLTGISLAILIVAPVASSQVYLSSEQTSNTGESSAAGGCPFVPTFAAGEALPEEGKAYIGPTYGALVCPNWWEWTATHDFTLGSTEVVFFLGCDAGAVSGTAGSGLFSDFHIQLFAGEQELFVGFTGAAPAACTPGDVFEIALPIDHPDTEVAEGTLVRLSIGVGMYNTFSGDAAGNVYLATGEATPSRLASPGLVGGDAPSGPVTVFEDLADNGFSHSFVSPQNNTWHFNYTSTQADGRFVLEANVTGGAADLTVTDAGGAEVLRRQITEDTQEVATFASAAPGNWTIVVAYDGFTGGLDFGVAETVDGGPTTTTGTTTGTAGPTTGQPTTDPTPTPEGNNTSDDEESPGLATAGLLGAVGAAAVAARRRTR